MASKNIVAKGTTYNGVESITLPVSGGGDATFYEISDTTAVASDVLNSKWFYASDGTYTQGTGAGGGGDTWSWMGKNPIKVKNITSAKVYLEDTDYATWTPSTTATTIAPSTALEQETVDCVNYDYIILARFHSHHEYDPSATQKSMAIDYYYSTSTCVYGYTTSYIEMSTNTMGGTASLSISSSNGLFYLNASGNNAYRRSTSYGGAYVNTWAAVGNASASGTQYTFTPNTPIISARCSSNYFSTANAELIDQSTSYFEYVIELWKIDKCTSVAGGTSAEIRDMWLNGF